MSQKRKLKSFSLFELLIYISILSIVLISLSNFFWPIKKSFLYSSALLELERNLNSALSVISYNIRQAESINSCSGSDLDLKMSNASIDPTVFSLNNGVIYIKQNGESQYSLTGNKIYVDSLSFEEIINPSPAKPSVKIVISAHYIGPGRKVSELQRTVQSVVGLR